MALTQVSTDGIKDLSVKNADIASAAAIVGTKISPDFGSQNIVTTGNASVAGITTTADIDIQDNDKILLGTGDDLQLYHDGTDSFIDNATGGLKVLGDTIRFKGKSADETMLVGVVNGAVELYHNNVKKFETYSDGVICQDDMFILDDKKAIFGDGSDLQMYHDGSHSFVTNSTGDLVLGYSNIYLQPVSGENGLRSVANGATELYYDAVKKLYTESDGIATDGSISIESNGYLRVRATDSNGSTAIQLGPDGSASFTGGITAGNIDSSGSVTVDDSEKFVAGVGNDLQIYHDGSQSYIVNTTSDLYIQCASDENAIETNQNAGVKLYYDGGNKLQTISSGVQINGDLQLQGDDGTNDSLFWDKSDYILKFKDGVNAEWGNSRDLRIYHSGSHSFIHQDGTGTLYLLADTFRLNNEANTENIIAGNAEGAVELYYDNVWRLKTTSNGASINGSFYLSDNEELILGGGSDLKIYHNGTNSFIENSTGSLYIRDTSEGDIRIQGKSGEDSIICNDDGAVELYYDNSVKASTYANGLKFEDQGWLIDNKALNVGTGGDLKIYHDGTDSYIDNSTGNLQLRVAGTEKTAVGVPNGAMELYYDSVKKFETYSDGVICQDDIYILDNNKAVFGDGSDLYIYHNGSHSYIDDAGTGGLLLRSNNFHVTNNNGTESIIHTAENGSVECYYDNSKKLETTSGGITVQGSVTTQDINLSNLSAESPNEVDGSRGNWTMQEGADDLFLINRVNGKKYKFNLTEVG